MKPRTFLITIYLLFLLPLYGFSQRGPTDTGTFFSGGNYDGYGAASFSYREASSTDNAFSGGSYDGYGAEQFAYHQSGSTAALFTGGSYDGYAMETNHPHQPNSTAPMFTGGNYDGYAAQRTLTHTASNSDAAFTGGNYDGYSGTKFAYRQPSSSESPFTGGNYDGSAMSVTADDISLPVQIALFTAVAHYDGIHILIRTASEVDFAGFNIFRSDSMNSGYQLIASYLNNPQLRGQGNSTHGHEYSYQDTQVQPGQLYWYKLVSVDVDGSQESFGPISARGMVVPEDFALQQNFPNPFNPKTTITFQLPRSEQPAIRVKLEVFDVSGRLIRTLIDGEMFPGTYHVSWDGMDNQGKRAPSGVYFYRLSTPEYLKTRRMVLLK